MGSYFAFSFSFYINGFWGADINGFTLMEFVPKCDTFENFLAVWDGKIPLMLEIAGGRRRRFQRWPRWPAAKSLAVGSVRFSEVQLWVRNGFWQAEMATQFTCACTFSVFSSGAQRGNFALFKFYQLLWRQFQTTVFCYISSSIF